MRKLMDTKRRIHDGIARAVIAAGVGLGHWVDPLWLIIPGGLGLTLLQSAFKGFFSVYFVLDKTHPDEYHRFQDSRKIAPCFS